MSTRIPLRRRIVIALAAAVLMAVVAPGLAAQTPPLSSSSAPPSAGSTKVTPDAGAGSSPVVNPAEQQSRTPKTGAAGADPAAVPQYSSGVIAGVILMVLLMFAAPLAMLWLDIDKAYRFAGDTRAALVTVASQSGLDGDRLNSLLAELRQSPPGIPGLARTMLAFTLILVVALVLFFILVTGVRTLPDVVDKTITVLATAVTTVVAFYFGSQSVKTVAGAAVHTTVPVASGSTAGQAPPPPAGQKAPVPLEVH